MHELFDRPSSSRSTHRLAGALLLLPTLGCVVGEGSLGDYTETDAGTGSSTGPSADSGSSGDAPGCTEDCDPDFAVAYVKGANYGNQAITRLSTSTCNGPRCPEAVSPVSLVDGSPVEECLETLEAQSSPLGAEEHCRMSPSQLGSHVWLGFTTPVDRSSFELVRPSPEDPTIEEPYLWYPDVVQVQGPGTIMRGDYVPGGSLGHGTLTSIVNEACAARLTALSIPWTPAQLEALCVGTWDDGGVLRPLRMAPTMAFSSYGGELSTGFGWSCDTPESGPDTCCSACDEALGPAVARYGVDAAGSRRSPNEGTAIACDPAADPLVTCRDLVLEVEREPGPPYTYAWDGAPQDWPLPRYDKLRETHPEDRPAGLEQGAPCSGAGDCAEGQACIGTNAAGDACQSGAGCAARTCRAEWLGACQVVDEGPAFCVDRRFSSAGAGACLVATTDFAHGEAGDRLSQCDSNADGQPTAAECCDAALGGAAGCDPFFQPNLVEVPRHDRNAMLPAEAMCACEEGQPAPCTDVVDAWCEPPVGTGSTEGPVSPPGDYALPMVTQRGGVRWLADTELLQMHLATRGEVPRATTEQCAEGRGLIGERSPADAWLGNAELSSAVLREDHDLFLCSGSTYRVVLSESEADHHVRSLLGGNLDGRSQLVLETPQFRIAPGSLRELEGGPLESCDMLTLELSAAYDPSEANVRKLELRAGAVDGPRVAGGPDCDPLASPAEIAAGAIPCLGIDADGSRAWLSFYVDEEVHGQVLAPGTTYFVVLPGLVHVDQMADPAAYAGAFHDACGMPLVVGQTPEELALWELSFTVDAACG